MLVVVGGYLAVLYQWHMAELSRQETELARQEAVASDQDTRQVLNESIEFNPMVPLSPQMLPRSFQMEPLLESEKRCQRLLQRKPDDIQTRIVLTKVRGNLGVHCSQRGRMAEALAHFASARDLWEPLVQQNPANLENKRWLATTLEWQVSTTATLDDPGRAIPVGLQLETLYEELAEEDPANPLWMERVWVCFTEIRHLITTRATRSAWHRPVEEEVRRLRARSLEEPDNRVVHKRLGLLCLLLGDIYLLEQAAHAAIPLWQEAYREHRNLNAARHDDLANQFRLAGCCERLMQERTTDPFYLDAVTLLEQVGGQLAKLSEAHPEMLWYYAGALKCFDRLALCHVKAGAMDRFETVCARQVRLLESLPSVPPANPVRDLATLKAVLQTANDLLEARRSAAGLLLARKVAAAAMRCSAVSSRDLHFNYLLAAHLRNLAMTLRHLHAPAEALVLAEQSRRLYDELLLAVPEMHACAHGLSDTWQVIAKGRWEVGQHDESLAAFRQSTAVMRCVFEQSPLVPAHRFLLGQCLRRQTSYYERLDDWAGLTATLADRNALAATLLEREKLWPEDAKELHQVAEDFLDMAQRLAQKKERLSADEAAEQQRYREHGERIRLAAEDAARRARVNGSAATGTSVP